MLEEIKGAATAKVGSLESFVRWIDQQLLHTVSGKDPGKTIVYKQWVKLNGKLIKQLLVSETRAGKRKDTMMKSKLTLQKPIRKKQAEKVDLTYAGEAPLDPSPVHTRKAWLWHLRWSGESLPPPWALWSPAGEAWTSQTFPWSK